MRKISGLTAMTLVLILGLVPAYGMTTLHFQRITYNNMEDLSGQLFADLYFPGENAPNPAGGWVNIGPSSVGVHFRNAGAIPSVISEIYVDDGFLVPAAPLIYDNPYTGGPPEPTVPNVDFDYGASPPDLPGGNSIFPPFNATPVFTTSAVNPAPKFGISNTDPFDVAESLLLVFQTSGNILDEINSGGLRFGLHVTGIGEYSGSDSYVNVVPVPGTLLLLGSALVSLTLLKRQRRE